MDEHLSDDKCSSKNTTAYEFWKTTLKSARYIVAPMVDQSELAWRMLSRKYEAELCYTPMFHAALFVKDPNYRRNSMQTCSEDRPLIVQFCANDPDILLAAAKLVEDQCDAVDINFGCPQVIAKNGHYGAYLQDEWELITKMVKICHENLKVPITCKIRVFPTKVRTVEYAKMIEKAGCQLLTVHGRTREMKGMQTGIADWSLIKAVKEAVSIPVFANGNIQYLPDVHRCLEETGVEGVMTAEGNLHNPALFTGKETLVWDLALEYLDLAQKFPCPVGYIRGHVFKMCHHALSVHKDVRELVASARTVEEFTSAVHLLRDKCADDMEEAKVNREPFSSEMRIDLPYWLCQPYVRPCPDDVATEDQKQWRQQFNKKRAEDLEKLKADHSGSGLSVNKLKKRLKHPHKNFDPNKRRKYTECSSTCHNPRSAKCEFTLCKFCCRTKTSAANIPCKGHNFRVRKSLEENPPTMKKNHLTGDEEEELEDTALRKKITKPLLHDDTQPTTNSSKEPETISSEIYFDKDKENS